MDKLPLELLEQVVCSHFVAPRAVCKQWRDIFDDVLRLQCESDLHTMLENCRIRVVGVEREGWVRRRLLRYRFAPIASVQVYKCGVCGKFVVRIADCECHAASNRNSDPFPWLHSFLGPCVVTVSLLGGMALLKFTNMRR